MNKTQKIQTLVREALEGKFYEARVLLHSDRNINLTIILDELRGVCGITIVSVTGPAKPLSSAKEKTDLKIKFLVTGPSLKRHVREMKARAQSVHGVYSFRVTEVNKLNRRGDS